MARWLLDCRPLCGRPWLLGLATEPAEREALFRLRADIFFRERDYGPVPAPEHDSDPFDDWAEHIMVWDVDADRPVGTYRVILGREAARRGELYGNDMFDLSPLAPILDRILQGGRTCVAAGARDGPAFAYLSYGMELLRREHGCDFFLGAESFRPKSPDELNLIDSYLRHHARDPEFWVEPLPANRVEGLRDVPTERGDVGRLPGFIRLDVRMGFLAVSPPTWDPWFRSYDVLMLGRFDRLTSAYHALVGRAERRPARAGG